MVHVNDFSIHLFHNLFCDSRELCLCTFSLLSIKFLMLIDRQMLIEQITFKTYFRCRSRNYNLKFS